LTPTPGQPAVTRAVIQVCGRLVIEVDGERAEHLLPGRLGRVLFVYLVLNRTRDSTRDELIGALWPDGPPASADVTLRALVSRIRRAIGAEVQGRGGGYRLVLPPQTQIDVEVALDAIHRAETAAAAGEWRRAWGPALVALFTAGRGFLPGEEAVWINAQRRVLANLELNALECYATSCLGIGGMELSAAERAARRLVELEPFRESGHRVLMRALAERGNVADALRAYERLTALLRSELGVDPGPQTRDLHRELLRLAY
jgi:DNA-binding SARP family transcriptional activator